MNAKHFSILLLATVVMIGAAMMTFQREQTKVQADQKQPVFPQLISDINQVTKVIVKHQSAVITLSLQDNQWHVKEKSNYLANQEQVQQLLLGLATAKTLEAKTKKPERYAKLGVEDVAKDAASTQVIFNDQNGKTIIDVILGKTRPGNYKSFYLRKTAEKSAWLVKGEATAAGAATAWLQKDLLNIVAKRIKHINIMHLDGTKVVSSKASKETEHFTLQGIPEGATVKSEYMVDQLATALQSLELEDVKPAADVNLGDKATISQYQTFDGLMLTIKTAMVDGHSYSQISAIHIATGEKAQQADIIKEVNALNEKLSPWVFQLPENQLAGLQKTMAELIDMPKAKDPEASDKSANANESTEPSIPSATDIKSILANPLSNMPKAEEPAVAKTNDKPVNTDESTEPSTPSAKETQPILDSTLPIKPEPNVEQKPE